MSALLLSLSASSLVEAAIALASPSLYEGIVRLHSGEMHARREKHIFSGLLRYLVRMSTRPTPFGLFAGIAPGFFGEKTTLQLGVPALGRLRTRPDMSWLLALLKHLEASPSLLTRLTVQRNQLVYPVGGRIILLDDDPYGQKQDQTLSLRATPAVRKTLELTHEPVAYPVLRDALQASFPGVKQEKIVHLLEQLWEHGVLISTLHPSLTDVQPASTLLRQLEKLEGTDEARQLLAAVLAFSAAVEQGKAGQPLEFPAELAALQRVRTSSQRHTPLIQVDSLLSLSAPTLHKDIGTVAARAAELLLRLTPFPQGAPHLQAYRHQFLEKYGPGAEVPLLELLSPELGLDAPPGYTRPPRAYQENGAARHQHQERRERVLQTLMQEALADQSLEVALTRDHLAALETWQPRAEQAPRSLEIYLHIHAASRQALDEGHFWAIVGPNPGSSGAGRSSGRFFDLLGPQTLDALRQLLAREEALEADAIFAEFSYQPTNAREANVALRPLLRTYEIAVGTTPALPSTSVIPLHDLLVGVRDERFYLRSRRLNKRVIVCQLHMLTAVQAPNVCRFLTEIASDGLPMLAGFDWGSLASAPFLPRVTVPHGA
ncbi:MAG TPA: lantibiotic dehydratase family protein, partial [Ktedonobacteraceae bacterium]|nr:lantibiotic dehydratase family protein [Ktedonobacteraceae bacterium]